MDKLDNSDVTLIVGPWNPTTSTRSEGGWLPKADKIIRALATRTPLGGAAVAFTPGAMNAPIVKKPAGAKVTTDKEKAVAALAGIDAAWKVIHGALIASELEAALAGIDFSVSETAADLVKKILARCEEARKRP